MTELAEAPQQTEENKINAECKKLFADCKSMLEDFGEKKRVKLSDKIINAIANALSSNPTKNTINPIVIERRIYMNGTWEKVSIIDVDDTAKQNQQIQIVLGNSDKPEEILVMQEKKSWIFIRRPYRDINEPGTPPPSTREVTPADVKKYQEAVSIVRTRSIHG